MNVLVGPARRESPVDAAATALASDLISFVAVLVLGSAFGPS